MESLLHYIWKYRLFTENELKTTSGSPLKIIDVGIHNHDEGPDFFNAKIVIDGTLWAGNIEIHTYSSDWYKHRHEMNPVYNTVILHVAKYVNTKIYRQDQTEISQLELVYPSSLDRHYEYLLYQETSVPCSLQIKEIPEVYITSWLNRLQVERLEYKTERILNLQIQCKNNWEEVLYITLARYFGGSINGDIFERLARSLPLTILLKHRDSLFCMEALLFGQAGFLEDDKEDMYYLKLKREYDFFRRKYKLKPLRKGNWKFHRLRPFNFPELKIAQFAAIYKCTGNLFSCIRYFGKIEEISSLFKKDPSSYWEEHYNFKQHSPARRKVLGEKMIRSLVINVIVPILFTYGRRKDDEEIKEKAMFLLENTDPEENNIIKMWQECGLRIRNAADTQALIHLKRFYCEQKKCLYCGIGQQLLAGKTVPKMIK